MIGLMETIFRTHRPTWDDIIQLLVSLFSTEERYRILTEARKWFREMASGALQTCSHRQNQPPLMRGPNGIVKLRKGGAPWRDNVQLFYKASREGPENL